MSDKDVATEKVSDGNSSLVQPSQPAPSAAADASSSDPDLVSDVFLQLSGTHRFLILDSLRLIDVSTSTGNLGRPRRPREPQELANKSQMDNAASDVVVQFPFLNEFGHYGPSIERYPARSPFPILSTRHIITVGLSIRHCSGTSGYGSPIRGFWEIDSPSVD